MNRSLFPALGLIVLGLLGGCPGGGNTALTTVPTAHLAITPSATTVMVGTPFTFTVTALDATNAVVPTYVGTVHITASDKSATLPHDGTLTRGVGSFTVTFRTAGSQTITASDTVGNATSASSPAVSVEPIPASTVASISPANVFAGDARFTLTVNGSNLVPGSVVQWNGGNRSTVFVSSSQVTAQISSTDIAEPGTAAVTVFTPGGGTSNTSTFTITRRDSKTMTAARADHSATLLSDGRVLIVGGYGINPFAALASAELYDPSTGTFTPTGTMHTARAGHTATRLADGRVLIAGGQQPNPNALQFVTSAEIYDPATEMFTTTGNMIAGGFTWSAAELQDGRVFIAEDGNAEIYDPATGKFALAASYGSGWVLLDRAALLSNGKVLVVGCAAQCYPPYVSAVYDPKNDTFTATGPWAGSSALSTATLLGDGTVLYVEGNDSDLPDDAEIYDPSVGTFTAVGHTINPHEFSTATRLGNGTVLIAGGQLLSGGGSQAVEIYSPVSRTFVSAVGLIVGRASHTATLLADGSVLMIGGYSVWLGQPPAGGWRQPTASAERYQR
jgi:Galactose oxidase, central domain